MGKLKGLLIAEKPSLMSAIRDVYNAHYSELPYSLDFVAQHGHLIQQIPPNAYCDEWADKWDWSQLPMFPQKLPGGWKYDVISSAKDTYKKISEKFKTGNYDFIVHAGDPDREGQYLVRLVLQRLKCKLPVKRFWSNDLTDKAVLNALKQLRDDDHDEFLVNLTHAAYCRAKFDWLLGMNGSRAATLAMNSGALRLGAVRTGRVKTPLLNVIVNRELDIQNFKPVTTYGVECVYKEGFSGLLFDDEGTVSFKTISEAKSFIGSLDDVAKVVSFDRKAVKHKAPAFFKLSSLQVEANKSYGFSADKTLELAQSLYEKHKVLTYPRTDCEYVSKELGKSFNVLLKSVSAFPELKRYVGDVKSDDISAVISSSRYINDKKLQESGHSALLPTETIPDVNKLSGDEYKLLLLVFKRFLAAFMSPELVEETTVITDNSGNTFKSNGKVVKDKGYTVLFDKKENDVVIPVLSEGQTVYVSSLVPKEQTTTCPKRYTDADLISLMENPVKFLHDSSLKDIIKSSKGIGTPATRANIIKELVKNGYIQKKKGKGKSEGIYATPIGIAIIQNLGDRDIASVDLTAQWEEKLGFVESGEMSAAEFDDAVVHYIDSLIKDLRHAGATGEFTASASSNGKGEALCKCPRCGADIVENRKAFSCSRKCGIVLFKEDKFLGSLGKKMTKTYAKGLFTKGQVVVKDVTSKKTGNKYDLLVKVDFSGQWPKYSTEFPKSKGKKKK